MTLTFYTTENTRLDEFLRRELPGKIDISWGAHGSPKSENPPPGAVALSPENRNLSTGDKITCSNSKIRRLIIAGCVTVNGHKITRPAFDLRGKSSIIINFDKEKFFYEKPADDIKFEVTDQSILFENDDLIFVNKPAFFPVEQTIVGNRDNLHDALVRYLWARNPSLRNPPYVGIMHRLDHETSGIILFTKNRAINKSVQAMFQNHDFEKEYTAIVTSNKILKVGQKFTVEMFMERVSGKSQQGKWGPVPESRGGKYSRTDFEVVGIVKIDENGRPGGIIPGENVQDEKSQGKKSPQFAYLIKANLYTGRTHQIRVHLASKNMPILGDLLYGGRKSDRGWLHASRFKGMGIEVVCEMPWDSISPLD